MCVKIVNVFSFQNEIVRKRVALTGSAPLLVTVGEDCDLSVGTEGYQFVSNALRDEAGKLISSIVDGMI